MTRLIILFFAAIAAFAQQVSAPSPALTWAGGATAPVFSATPTFDLALALRWQPGAMTANVTSVTFSNKVAGMKFSLVWTQDGTGGRTVAYGASASGTCTVSPTLNVATTQQFEIAADGTTVLGVGCTSTDAATLIAGPTRSAPGTPGSGLNCWFDSTTNTLMCKDSSAVVTTLVPAATKTRGIGFTFDNGATALAVGTVGYYTVPFACTIAAWNATVDAGTITVDVWKIATGTAIPTASNKICASACPAIASGTALHSTTLTGWTTAVAANDILGFYVSAAATATKASVTLECGQ